MDAKLKAARRKLVTHAKRVGKLHLRRLLPDPDRAEDMRAEACGILLDYSRQNATAETTGLLVELAKAAGLKRKITAMLAGRKINRTEGRAALHTALRAPRDAEIVVDGTNVVPAVHAVRRRVADFASRVRAGEHRGATDEPLTAVVAIGIGGSYLGPEFVAEALATEPSAAAAADGRTLRFLANVDPIDVERALRGLDPARTLAVVISKTFTTAETMLNARTVRAWLTRALGDGAVERQMVAVSTARDEVAGFGIPPKRCFGFWDWVGGRYSVCSAVGLLPLSLQYGPEPLDDFLAGARELDEHFAGAPFARNLPVLLGLYGVWNSEFLGRPVRALLPYCQALHRFPAHVQQLDMESNGKRVTLDGRTLRHACGEVDFGEPGTNGQHSFYQLLHQGRVVPADFIGFTASQTPRRVAGHPVDSHDELMANCFAQPDALAVGRTAGELRSAGVPERLIPNRVFPGNRPSNVLLVDGHLDARNAGRLLALYEHRTAVQGFVWGIDSFDQWGVQLGKELAGDMVDRLRAARDEGVPPTGCNPATAALLERYLGGKR